MANKTLRSDLLSEELQGKPGLTDFRFSWGEDGGLVFDPAMPLAQRALVLEVVAAHQPDRVPPVKPRTTKVQDFFTAVETLPNGPTKDTLRLLKGLL